MCATTRRIRNQLIRSSSHGIWFFFYLLFFYLCFDILFLCYSPTYGSLISHTSYIVLIISILKVDLYFVTQNAHSLLYQLKRMHTLINVDTCIFLLIFLKVTACASFLCIILNAYYAWYMAGNITTISKDTVKLSPQPGRCMSLLESFLLLLGQDDSHVLLSM